MLTAAARSFLITTSLICFAALFSACGGSTTHEEEHHHSESSSSSTEPVHSSSSEAPTNKPDAFIFEDQDDVEPGSEVTSNTLEIEGLDEPAEIEITGGYYAINSVEDDAFTDQPGTIDVDDELTLRTQAPANGSQVQEVTVTIAGVQSLWRVSTPEDTEAPQAAFAFPTPMTATDAETLTLRGTASDELSQIDAVTVTVEGEGGTEVYTVDSDDGFATWTVEVSLAPGDNQIQLGAEDVLGNADDEIAEITLVRQSFDLAFPDNEEPFLDVRDMAFDSEGNRLFVAIRDVSLPEGTGVVVAVDLKTGERTRFAGGETEGEFLDVRALDSIAMDQKRNRLLLGPSRGELITVDLNSGERQVLAAPDLPSVGEPTFRGPEGVLLDPENEDFAYVVSTSDRRLLHLNLNTGERRIISDDENGEGVGFHLIRSVVIGPENDFAYVNSVVDRPIYKVNLETGDRIELDMENYPNPRFDGIFITDMVSAPGRNRFYIADQAENILLYDIETSSYETVVNFSYNDHFEAAMHYHMSLDEDNQVIMLVDRRTKAVVAVDLQTQEYVLISKSVDEDDN